MKFSTISAFLASAPLALGAIVCTTLNGSPLLDDCIEAFAALPYPPAPGAPVACPLIYAPVWKLAEAGSCRIEAYSSTGSAACTDRREVIQTAGDLFRKCASPGNRVEGVAELSKTQNEDTVFEGIRIVRSGQQAQEVPDINAPVASPI
ncbi:hypothetical protein BJ508DRAFT_13662 [Ascobolus immersus RN42]|uniref:Uncharacterized protein n=1 Tax=Ascobolus immersus RN42 TaxID=1160509 RepID=A0A3N4IG77_ASCIM|nr:hypothetical protein BJ508DRAFT_13662 [Ascobolus immersus RN42]